MGELVSVTNGAGKPVGYSYDADGDTTAITYPLPASATWAISDTVSYGYDHADILSSVTDFNGNQISITNNGDGQPTAEDLASTGDTFSTTYDQAGNPAAITLANTSSTLQSFTYADAPSGDVLSETDSPGSATSPADYAYDAQGRVTSLTAGTGAPAAYTFDASGNLTTLPTGATGTYDHDDELISSTLGGAATTSYSYGADGERLTATQGGATLAQGTWNGGGQLVAYDNAAADMTAATYDGDGLRTSATTGSASQTFTWDTAASIPELLQDSSNAYIYTTGNTPQEQVSLTTGNVTYLISDANGSVRGALTGSGTLAGTVSYDAWGNPQGGGLANITPFGFAGGYTDPTGLLYLINRYYDPPTGQFLSVDPLVGQTLIPYGYADGNPVSNTDPSGECPCITGGSGTPAASTSSLAVEKSRYM